MKAKVRVFRDGRVFTLKGSADFLAAYLGRHLGAVVVKSVPSVATLERWDSEGYCKAVGCGCRVEPDGTCHHGHPSWLRALGWI
jgi:hypothetical protein